MTYNETVIVTGTNVCTSTDGGFSYSCLKHAEDAVFDGGIAFSQLPPTPTTVGK